MSGVTAWRNGVVIAYAGAGLTFSTWVSRLPAIKDDLALTPGTVGLLLLCMSLGSFVSVAASGLVVLRLGSKLTTRLCSAIQCAGIIMAGIGASVLASPAAVGVGLVFVGLGTGSWGASSNIEGAAVERALGRNIMPRLHGSFSIGTVAGAGLGAVAAALHVPVGIHLSAIAAIVAVAVWTSAAYYQADARAHAAHLVELDAGKDDGGRTGAAGRGAGATKAGTAKSEGRAKIAAAWRDPRTLLLGVLVLGLSLSEGAAGDWVALAMVEGHQSSKAMGAVGYGFFVTAMTVGRFAGTLVLDKYGRVTVLRASAAVAAVGLAIFVFAPSQGLALAALLLWGLGSALCFPVAMSAASDDPVHAAARVSVVSTIGYGAFLGGPPLLGLIAEHVGVLHSLLAVVVMVVISFILTPVVRRPAYLDAAERTPAAGERELGLKGEQPTAAL